MPRVVSPRVFVDVLESFFYEYGGHQSIVASAFADYIRTDWFDYVGSYTDACYIRDILNNCYDLKLPPIDAIQWVQYVQFYSTRMES